MKTSRDPRHLKRIAAIKDLFAWEFHEGHPLTTELAQGVIKHLAKIDKEIKKAAPTWPINQINKIDLAILRLAVYELKILPQHKKGVASTINEDIIKKGADKTFGQEEIPYKVVIDEAIELAKEFGSESSPGFINGALGNLIENLQERSTKDG